MQPLSEPGAAGRRPAPILPVLLLVVAGCASPASPPSSIPSAPATAEAPETAPAATMPVPASPSPDASATASPAAATSAATSPEAAFRQLADSDAWSLPMDVAGMVLTSADGIDVYINPVSGVVDVGEGSARMLLAGPDRTGTRVFEDVRVAGVRSVRGPDATWRDAAADEPANGLLDALVSVPAVHTAGTEVVDGTELTILAVDEPVTIGTLGGVRAAEEDSSGRLSFLVDADGRPVRVRVDLDAPRAGVPAVESLELAATSGSMPPAGAAAWTTYESKRGYAIGMPSACEALTGDEHWEDFRCGDYYLRIWTEPTKLSGDAWASDSISAWRSQTGAEPDVEDTLLAGSPTAGEAGTIATYRYEQDGYPVVLSDGVFVHGGTGFDVLVLGLAENAARDRAVFLQHLATMQFTE